MKIIVISCPDTVDHEVDYINHMFEEGLKLFHLRKPGHNEEELEKYLENIKHEYHYRIRVHGSYKLLDRYNLGGIHIPVEMIENSNILELKKIKKIGISCSFHSIDEVITKNKYIDYAFLSPVFDSISKRNYKGRFDHKYLSEILPLAGKRIVALGGCNAENLNIVKRIGFSGAAVLGAIWNNGDPFENFIKIKKAAEKLTC